jgi:transcription antitermination protein NusB
MINRRNIRIKALQVVYSFDTAGLTPTLTEVEKALKTKFNQTGALLNYLISLTVDIAKYVETYSNQKANKHITTQADLNVNIKIAGNNVIWQLMENKTFALACNNTNTETTMDRDLVKQLFLNLEKTPEYNNYINNDSRTNEEDTAIMIFVFENIILANDDVVAQLMEQFQNYDDDIEMLFSIIHSTIEKPKNTQFTKLITADKATYAYNLANTYYQKHDVIMEYIKPKLKNWDADRVAKLDMIALQLGICELLFFETIPVKVTINEYIDIAKDYSTPQSGQFVNGILDGIHKDLEKEGKLNKVDFRKF